MRQTVLLKNGVPMIPLTQIGGILGRDVHLSTTHNWFRVGGLHNGERIKLQVIKIGSRYFTTEEHVRSFIGRLNTTEDNETSQLLDEFNV